VKPFSLAKPSQFRVAPPPALLAIASTNPKALLAVARNK
jgi:hypothetical protein